MAQSALVDLRPGHADPDRRRVERHLAQGQVRPIATIMLMIAISALGLASYRRLPVAALPTVDTPTIQVTASLPGADPQTMVASVVTPLERQFGQIPDCSR